jgi:diguanylate cyclase (GGDEF)-like protein
LKIRDHASQFCVLVLSTDADWGAEVKKSLTQAGYENILVTETEDLPKRLRHENPHVLVFSVLELLGPMSLFVESALKFNPEMRFVVVGDNDHFDALVSYEEHGLEQFVTFQKENLGLRVAAAVDRICEKLFYIYQNEQLAADIKKQAAPPEADRTAMTVTTTSIGGPSLAVRVMAYQSLNNREALVQKYFEFVGLQPLIYLRFLPSVNSFVATQATGLAAKEIQGVGCQIEGLAMRDLTTQLSLGVVPAPILDLAHKNFKIKNPRLQTLFSSGQLEGLIVYSADLPASQIEFMMEEFSLFALAFSYLDLQKRVDRLEVQDPVTEIYNRKYYDLEIIEEVERALRIKQAVSLLKISLDNFAEIEQILGDNARDLLLKKIAQLILKSSRTNDVIARTALNEFSAIMPHCHRQGAMVRGERIRRMIENSLTMESGVKVTVSIGISEYPTLCKSATHLEETATKALHHIASRGGNKVCLFKAPADHSPEFDVVVEPG